MSCWRSARLALSIWRVPILHEADNSVDGRGGFRTCDLSRVKRALSH